MLKSSSGGDCQSGIYSHRQPVRWDGRRESFVASTGGSNRDENFRHMFRLDIDYRVAAQVV